MSNWDDEYRFDRLDKLRTLTALRALGATKAVVHFSGGHDEGGAESIEVYKGEELIAQPSEYGGEYGNLGERLAAPVYGRYYTFAGEFYVSGTVTWDVAAGTVTMDADESVPTAYSESW